MTVADNVVKKLLKPYSRNPDSEKTKLLLQLINKALKNRKLATRRRVVDFFARFFDKRDEMQNNGDGLNTQARRKHHFEYDRRSKIESNDKPNPRVKPEGSDFGNFGNIKEVGSNMKTYRKANNNKVDKTSRKTITQNRFKTTEKNLNSYKSNIDRSDENDKLTIFFKELSDNERNKVKVKELIENVKEMEALRKYETLKVETTTAKHWLNHDYSHEESSDVARKADWDEISPKNNKKPNFRTYKNDKMSDLDDDIFNLKTKSNSKIINIQESDNARSPYANKRNSYVKNQRSIYPRRLQWRPPSTKRKPPYDSIRPPAANRPQSKYLSPQSIYTYL